MLVDMLPEPRTPVPVLEVDEPELRAWQLTAPLFKQPNLPHQFDLKFALSKTRVMGYCNCGWNGRAYKPTDSIEGLKLALAEYAAHLRA